MNLKFLLKPACILASFFFWSSCQTPAKVLDKSGMSNEKCKEAILSLQKRIYLLENKEFYGYKFESSILEEQKKEFVDAGTYVTRIFDKNKGCAKNLTKGDIIKLFGIPPNPLNQSMEKEFWYFFSFSKNCPCVTCGNNVMRYNECSLLRFEFDTNGMVRDIDFIANDAGWQE